jgi:hypothetical protein
MEDEVADAHQIRQRTAAEAEIDGEIGVGVIECVLRGQIAGLSARVQRFGAVGEFKDDRGDSGERQDVAASRPSSPASSSVPSSSPKPGQEEVPASSEVRR